LGLLQLVGDDRRCRRADSYDRAWGFVAIASGEYHDARTWCDAHLSACDGRCIPTLISFRASTGTRCGTSAALLHGSCTRNHVVHRIKSRELIVRDDSMFWTPGLVQRRIRLDVLCDLLSQRTHFLTRTIGTTRTGRATDSADPKKDAGGARSCNYRLGTVRRRFAQLVNGEG
jgi:hypothetical protein